MHLFRTGKGPVVEKEGRYFAVARGWSDLVNDDALHEYLLSLCQSGADDETLAAVVRQPLPPIGDQELWAAGVTYFRSRVARIEESQDAGGADFYDRVYAAERPELFLKATPHRVVGPGDSMHLRRDSQWIVPEPELVLLITRNGNVVGYTIGNDLSCRDIEGENPLYLPQAKTFDRCAAIGPGILVALEPPHPDTVISLAVERNDAVIYEDSAALSQMKRPLQELVGFLFRDNSHPNGCLLMTGTGIVPSADFTLRAGDVVSISITSIGTLVNSVH
jgi:2-dehydro-3-deoxy-D-arabinonate dehydratase